MILKERTETEITLREVPEELETAVNQRLDLEYKLLSLKRIVSYPYRNKERQSVTFKAYMIYGNLLVLLTKWEFMNEIKEDSMTAGDIKRMSDLFEDHFKLK